MLRAALVDPNAEKATLDELKVAMEAAPNKRSYIRLAAIRSLLLGIQRATLCQQFCRTDRMVRLWIELFNSGGIDALITRPRSGRPSEVKLERVRDLLLPVLENPTTAASCTGRVSNSMAISRNNCLSNWATAPLCGRCSFWTTPPGTNRRDCSLRK